MSMSTSEAHVTPETNASIQNLAAAWLSQFAAALRAQRAAALSPLFTESSDWRDLGALTWDFTTTYDRDAIATKLISDGKGVGARNFALDLSRTAPRRVVRAGQEVIEAIYRFETDTAHCSGVMRLSTDTPTPQAVSLLTALHELTGFEERRGARRPHGTAYSRTFGGENWADLRKKAREYADREPEVLVVGGAQAGLAAAARLGAIGVDTLVIDALPRVGDVWRNRYHSLTLHNEAWAASLPYLEFPDTWPTYIPKDKLAGWLEHYAHTMEINVWTSTRLVSGSYDNEAAQWIVTVERDGVTRTLRPRHIVMCTGSFGGTPNMPDLPGLNDFAGDVMHSSAYTSGTQFKHRKALVIGTGTSGHDVAQDLHALGSQVTIVQRTSTTVVSIEPSGVMVYALFSEGLPIEDADLIAAASSMRATIRGNQVAVPQMLAADKSILDRLDAVGFRTDVGPDGSGFHLKFYRRGGGYYINVGASELIADREIGLLQWDEIDMFVPQGVRLKDGNVVEADLVVLATGYRNQQEDIRRWFGDDVADRIGPIWGVGDDDEIRNIWRPTAQPGLWFNAGGLAACRMYSKYMSMLIKAELVGLKPTTRDGQP